MTQTKQRTSPEWSYRVEEDKVRAGKPLPLKISPGPGEKKELAKRLGIEELNALEAGMVLTRNATHIIYVSGVITADLTQACVVTLEPVHEKIEENFEAWFADTEQAVSLTKIRHDREVRKGKGERPVLDESEDPEPIVDGKIDLGELVTQYLSLFINPYPHAEGAHYEVGDDAAKRAGEQSELRKNPFAALKDWKKNL